MYKAPTVQGTGLGLARLAVTHYGVALLVVLLAYGLGRRILKRVRFANGYEEFSFSAGLGLGIFAQAVFLLGLLRLIYAGVTVVMLLGAAAVGWRELSDGAVRFWVAIRSSTWTVRCLAAAVVLVILWVAILPLYPPHLWDALSYHLPSARIYAHSHAVRPTPYLRFCVFTQLNEMLYTLVLTFSDAISVQALEFLLLLLTAAAIAGAASRVSRAAVVPAVLAWIGIPEVLVIGSQAYIDVGLALFVTLLIVAAWYWRLEGEGSWYWLGLAAINGGFAASIKYTALFVIGCFGLALCVWAFRERSVRRVVVFAILVALVAGPWYAYVYYHTGNPVFPFLSRIFGTGCWDARDVAHVNRELGNLGTGRSLKSFLLLPWNMAFRESKFHLEASLSPLLFLGIPVWIVAGIVSRRTRFLALISAVFLLFWFATAQVPRYLFPVLPVICVLFGQAAAWIGQRLESIPRAAAWGILSILAAWPGVQFTRERIRVLELPPVNSQQTENFFRRFRTYDCYRWLNERYGERYVLYAFDAPYMSYFANGTRIGDILGVGRVRDISIGSGRALKSSLKKFAPQFVLFASDPDFPYPAPQDEYFRSYFRPVATCSTGTLWRISEMAFKEQRGEQLLANGGFEQAEQRWTVGHQLSFDSTGRNSHSGQVAVRVEPSSIPLSQGVRVNGDRSYELTFFSRSAGEAADIRFVVTWLDANNRNIRDDVYIQRANPEWRRESWLLFAPPGAFWAVIYPESVGAQLWYDDISVRQVSYLPAPAAPTVQRRTVLGIYRAKDRRFFVRHEISEGFADEILDAPVDGLPVAGDWTGEGQIEPGVYAPATGVFHLLGRKPKTISMKPRAWPIAGDWNGKGIASVGVYDSETARFELRNESAKRSEAITFRFGEPGDLPVSGDWNGDGVTTIGVYRPRTATFYLRNSNTPGPPDVVVQYGSGNGIPVAGDWNSDGSASPGLFDSQNAVFHLRTEDGSEIIIHYGLPGDRPFAASRH